MIERDERWNRSYSLPPTKPPVQIIDPERERHCACGVTFWTRARNRDRCDTCRAKEIARVNEVARRKRVARRRAEKAGRV